MELNEEQEAEYKILLDIIEDDDDVVKVYTTLM
jgi:transcriptional/translational regulatory protein YebC/TACO1